MEEERSRGDEEVRDDGSLELPPNRNRYTGDSPQLNPGNQERKSKASNASVPKPKPQPPKPPSTIVVHPAIHVNSAAYGTESRDQ